MKIFNKEEYKNIAINCKTQEELNKVVDITGMNVSFRKYFYGEETNLFPKESFFRTTNGKFNQDFLPKGFTQINASDFIKEYTLDKNNWCIRAIKFKDEDIKKFMNTNNQNYSIIKDYYYGMKDGRIYFNTNKKWGTELTYEEFRKYIMKKTEINIIIPSSLKFSSEITEEIFNKITNRYNEDGYSAISHCHISPTYRRFSTIGTDTMYLNVSNIYGGNTWCIDNNPQGIKEITLKDILKENNMEKKIIGYKAPFDMLGSTDYISKGTIFTKKVGDVFYTNDGMVVSKNPLPKEIVEQWEPVYEQEFKKGDYIVFTSLPSKSHSFSLNRVYELKEDYKDYILLITKDDDGSGSNGWTSEATMKIVKFRMATAEEIRTHNEEVKIGKYKLERNIDHYKFGCKTFSIGEVAFLHRIVADKEINAEVTIQGTKITKQFLAKIMNK